MKERNLLNFARYTKHIYISPGYAQPDSPTHYISEKAWLYATPNSLSPANYLNFPTGTTVMSTIVNCF